MQNGDPWISAMVSDLSVYSNQPFVYWAMAVDTPDDDLSFEWDLDGDGQYDDHTETPAPEALASQGKASLAAPGIHLLGVRVSDGEGGVVTGSFEVAVTASAELPALSTPARGLLLGILIVTALAGMRERRRAGAGRAL